MKRVCGHIIREKEVIHGDDCEYKRGVEKRVLSVIWYRKGV
jgi:hypothetical protein